MIGAVITGRKVGSAFDCLNRRDLPAFLLAWTDEAIFIYPSTVSVGGKMGGKNAAARWFQRFMEQFPKMNFTVKDFCI